MARKFNFFSHSVTARSFEHICNIKNAVEARVGVRYCLSRRLSWAIDSILAYQAASSRQKRLCKKAEIRQWIYSPMPQSCWLGLVDTMRGRKVDETHEIFWNISMQPGVNGVAHSLPIVTPMRWYKGDGKKQRNNHGWDEWWIRHHVERTLEEREGRGANFLSVFAHPITKTIQLTRTWIYHTVLCSRATKRRRIRDLTHTWRQTLIRRLIASYKRYCACNSICTLAC